MLIDIVTHCYAVEYPHFADLLAYQVSSLFLCPPKCDAKLVACFCLEDKKTVDVLNWASYWLPVYRIPLSPQALGRRCIGRNRAAKETEADLVWFTDCDHTFQEGCLDRLASLDWPIAEGVPASMVFPKTIKIHQDYATGDQAAEKVGGKPHLVSVDKSRFVDKHYNRAIGGVQIVRGDFARKHGYLDGDSKWQKPADKPFGDFKDDVAYRGFCKQHGHIVGVDLPGVYRMRHSTTSYQ